MSLNMPSLPFDFSRWAFLSAPLADVLAACRVRLVEQLLMPHPHMTACIALGGAGAEVHVPANQDPMERQLHVRGLLARWNGVDVADWPMPVLFSPETTGGAA